MQANNLLKTMRVKVTLLTLSALSLVSAVSADMPSVNWTEIGDFISGVADIFPGILDLVVAVLPVIIVLAIVGFVTLLFDKILSGIRF